MSEEDFPLPEVAETLRPYIKPRIEVDAIRRSLQKELQNQLQKDDVPLSSINLTDPQGPQFDDTPATLTGVRKAYLKALQAHAAAQAKHHALRSELERMKSSNSGSHSTDGGRSLTLVNDNYIPLLRQQQKHRKLKVIDRALSDIGSARGDISTNVDDVVRKKLGDWPSPPSAQPSSTRSPDVEAKLLELKKAVISTKRRVDRNVNQTPLRDSDSLKEVTPQAEIAGLQKALQELTSWMENQLTIIANTESETQAVADNPVPSGVSEQQRLSTDDIEALYEEYLEARQGLIRTVHDSRALHSATSRAAVDLHQEAEVSRGFEHNSTHAKSSAEILLPYIPTLVAAKQEEQTLMQQNTYIRRQIAAAEAETGRLLRRLADESHLVHPGASHGKDWAAAANEIGRATETFVNQRLNVGAASVAFAKQALGDIQSAPHHLDCLLEKD